MKKKKMPVFIGIVIAVVALIIFLVGLEIDRRTPSKEKAGQEEILEHFLLKDGYQVIGGEYDFSNATAAEDNQVAIILQNQIREERGYIDSNGKIYLDIHFVKNQLNHRFYWDNHENVLVYTTPTDVIKAEVGEQEYYVTKVKKSVDYVVVSTKGQDVYVALDFVKMFSNIQTEFYENPNRLCVIHDFTTEVEGAILKAEEPLRMTDTIKAKILQSYQEDMPVVIQDTKGSWYQVVTADGYCGYVQGKALKAREQKKYTSDFVEPEYTSIQKDKTISMGWHMITSPEGNNQLVDLVTNTKGMNVVCPTWFRLSDNEGNFSSLADHNYTTRAGMLGLEVWGMIDDQSPDSDNKEIFPYTSKRERLVNQLVAAAIEYNLAGLNIDFEYITEDIGEDYIQFLRELSVKCRINGIILSIDDKIPYEGSMHYDRTEQGIIADYVVLMAYDEHWGENSGAGSVASLPWVKSGIEATLREVPASKLICGIPFYTRIWEVDANDQFVSSQAVPIQTAIDTLANHGVEYSWVEKVGQNYGEYSLGENSVFRIWLEDAKSIEEKLKLITSYKLAGVSAWRLGMETPEIWNTIIKYTN